LNERACTIVVTMNDAVQLEESKFADALKTRGANVKVVRLPTGPDGAKQGLDDFLVAHGPDALRKLINNAEEAESPLEETREPASRIDPANEAAAYLQQTEKDGFSRLRFWRDSFWFWRGGRYVEWPESELRASITTFLNRSYSAVNMGAESNVLNQVKAASILSGRIDVPHWLDETPGSEWPVKDLLITSNKIVHLPSLFVGEGERAVNVTPRLFTTSGLEFPFSWNECPRPNRWLGFLDELWPDDDEAKHALQLWFGYCLTADTSQQKMLAVFGPKRSGKSTIARVLTKLVGENNTASPTMSNFGTNFGLWPLLGKPLAIIADARFSGRVDSAAIVERILRITGEDRVDVDRKYQPALTVRLPTRLMIISNDLPRLQDASGALVGRMIVLSLTKSWFGTEDYRRIAELSTAGLSR
jgi:putative DNA primase/helicase